MINRRKQPKIVGGLAVCTPNNENLRTINHHPIVKKFSNCTI